MKTPFSMRLATLLKNPPAWLARMGDCNDIVISSCVEYKRNLRDFPFSGWAEKTQRNDVFRHVLDLAAETEVFQKGFCAEMKDLSLEARRLLTEWQIITPTLAVRQDGCGVVCSPKGNVNMLINDEEHITLRVHSVGNKILPALEQARGIMQTMGEKLPFAHNERLGFLMSSPKEAGMGFRVSLILHLPGLTIADLIPQIANAAQPLAYEIRPLYGEDADGAGNLYEVSAVCIGDEDEESVLARMREVFITLTERELSIRDKFLGTRFYEFLDPVERGVGVLHYSVRVGWREALNHLSYIRMGDTMELVNWNESDKKRAAANIPFLMHTISSAFLKLHPEPELPEKDDPDTVRSFRIRGLLYPALPFGIPLD